MAVVLSAVLVHKTREVYTITFRVADIEARIRTSDRVESNHGVVPDTGIICDALIRCSNEYTQRGEIRLVSLGIIECNNNQVALHRIRTEMSFKACIPYCRSLE